MRRRSLVPLIALIGFLAAGAAADPLQPKEALALLERVADAARTLNYAGIFVYQYGDQVETSRIVHYTDASGEFEKLETLDGPRREIIRNNDEVLCYYPDAKILRSEKRLTRRSFPALLPEELHSLTEVYEIRKGDPERIAGFNSQALILEPKDGMRYGHKLWADSGSGLLLKARMVNERNHVVEQFMFTQLTIGTGVTRDMVNPSFNAQAPAWRFDRFTNNNMAGSFDSGWVVTQYPPGFHKIMEMRRSRQGSSVPITHLVYSDGLAAISIFIEPAGGRTDVREGLSHQGAINIYTRTVNDQIVTVLGEAPAVTVIQIANAVAYQGK